MFADPTAVTYNAVAKNLPAISRGDDKSVYRLVDSGGVTYELRLGHTYAKRNRFFARLQRDSAVTDPLVPAQNILASATATLTIDIPAVGVTPTDAQLLATALISFLNTGTNLLKLAGGET